MSSSSCTTIDSQDRTLPDVRDLVIAPAPPVSIVDDGFARTISTNQNSRGMEVDNATDRVARNSDTVTKFSGSQKYLAQIRASIDNDIILNSAGSKASMEVPADSAIEEWLKDRPPSRTKPGRPKQFNWTTIPASKVSESSFGTDNVRNGRQSIKEQPAVKTTSSSQRRVSTIKRITTPGLITPKYIDHSQSVHLLADFTSSRQAGEKSVNPKQVKEENKNQFYDNNRKIASLEESGVVEEQEEKENEDDDYERNDADHKIEFQELEETSFSDLAGGISPNEHVCPQELEQNTSKPIERHYLNSSFLKGDVFEKNGLKPLPDVGKRTSNSEKSVIVELEETAEAALLIEGYMSQYKGIRVASSTLIKEMSFNPFEEKKEQKLNDYDKEVLKEIYGSNFREENDKVFLGVEDGQQNVDGMSEAPQANQPSLFMILWLTLDDLFEDGGFFSLRDSGGTTESSSFTRSNKLESIEEKEGKERRGTLDTAKQHAKLMSQEFLLRGLSSAEAAISLNSILGREELQIYAQEKQRLLASKISLMTCPALTTSQWSFLGLIIVDALIRRHFFDKDKEKSELAIMMENQFDHSIKTVAAKFITVTSEELQKLRTFFFA